MIAENDIALSVGITGRDDVTAGATEDQIIAGAERNGIARADALVGIHAIADIGTCFHHPPCKEIEFKATNIPKHQIVAIAQRNGVAALTADDHMVAVQADDHIIATNTKVQCDRVDFTRRERPAGIEGQLCRVADHGDVAAAGMQPVVAGRTHQDVVTAATDQYLLTRRPQRVVLNGGTVPRPFTRGQMRPGRTVGLSFLKIGFGIDDPQRIGDQQIIAADADQRVVAAHAEQQIHPPVTHDHIIAAAAKNIVEAADGDILRVGVDATGCGDRGRARAGYSKTGGQRDALTVQIDGNGAVVIGEIERVARAGAFHAGVQRDSRSRSAIQAATDGGAVVKGKHVTVQSADDIFDAHEHKGLVAIAAER